MSDTKGPHAAGSQPAKRSVSFRASPSAATITEFSSDQSPNGNSSPFPSPGEGALFSSPLSRMSSSTISSSGLKPALKPSSRKLPPPEQYQHPDPLLRRLRLVDDKGNPIDLKKHFRDCKVVALYFSSQWAGAPLKEYQKTVADFQRHYPHEFKVVYISVDVDEEWYKEGVKGQPWVSMAWNDGSSSPSDRSDAATTRGFGSNTKKQAVASSDSSNSSEEENGLEEPPKLHNEEDFLLAGESDIDASLSLTDDGMSYLRPYSRVHLAAKLDILAAPTLAIYHVPSRKLIERNARIRRMQDNEREDSWERWQKGEGAGGIGFIDALYANRAMLFVSVLSLAYFLLVRIGGPDYNLLGRLIAGDSLTGKSKTEL